MKKIKDNRIFLKGAKIQPKKAEEKFGDDIKDVKVDGKDGQKVIYKKQKNAKNTN